MDDGLPGVGHVCDDTVGQDQQDEVLLQWSRCQATVGTEWGRQGQYQLHTRWLQCILAIATVTIDFFVSTCADSPKHLRL